MTCDYFMNDNVCPVQHLHEVAACDEQRDVAVPGGDHVSRNNARPAVISPLAGYGYCAAASAGLLAAAVWLLRGNDPTRPASHAHLRAGLCHHDIATHAGRNAAVSALAAELPALLLADVTGMAVTTATAGRGSTSRDWTQYLAART